MGIRQQSISSNSLILSSLGAIIFIIFNSTPTEASTKTFNFTLSSYNTKNFVTLMQKAQALAINSINLEFADPSITEVCVTILGEHNGQEVPLLMANVSRLNWQIEPKIERWSRYFASSERLLGFLKPQGALANSTTNDPVVFSSVKPTPQDDPGFRDD